MEKIDRYNQFYMSVAELCANMSHAIRKKVGCVLVRDGQILAQGWNGTPAGTDNVCEVKEYTLSRDINGDYFYHDMLEYPFQDIYGRYRLVTKQTVSHAEENMLAKIMRSNLSSVDATAYITMEPCIHCAKLLNNAGIKNVFYRESYREHSGIEYLESLNIIVTKI